jgi:hypothetical protein
MILRGFLLGLLLLIPGAMCMWGDRPGQLRKVIFFS